MPSLKYFLPSLLGTAAQRHITTLPKEEDLLVVLKMTHGAANLWTVQSLKKANIVALQPMEPTSGQVQNAAAAQMTPTVEKQDSVKAAATLATVRLGVQLVLLMDAQIQQVHAAGDSELLAETQSRVSHREPAL